MSFSRSNNKIHIGVNNGSFCRETRSMYDLKVLNQWLGKPIV